MVVSSLLNSTEFCLFWFGVLGVQLHYVAGLSAALSVLGVLADKIVGIVGKVVLFATWAWDSVLFGPGLHALPEGQNSGRFSGSGLRIGGWVDLGQNFRLAWLPLSWRSCMAPKSSDYEIGTNL